MRNTVTMSLDLEHQSAFFGAALADMVKRYASIVISEHARLVNKAVKAATPHRSDSARTLKSGILDRQSRKIGSLRDNIKVKKLPVKTLRKRFYNVIVAYTIESGDAHWYNYLNIDRTIHRETKKGYNRGDVRPRADFVQAAVVAYEERLINRVNTTHVQAIDHAFKMTPTKHKTYTGAT